MIFIQIHKKTPKKKFKITFNELCWLESHKTLQYKQYPHIIKRKERNWMKYSFIYRAEWSYKVLKSHMSTYGWYEEGFGKETFTGIGSVVPLHLLTFLAFSEIVSHSFSMFSMFMIFVQFISVCQSSNPYLFIYLFIHLLWIIAVVVCLKYCL